MADPTDLELERMELVHRLVRSPGFAAIAEIVEEQREQYFTNLARGLAQNVTPLDQREIDYKRGFWQGALYATQRLPKLKARDWDKLVADIEKEGEDTERRS